MKRDLKNKSVSAPVFGPGALLTVLGTAGACIFAATSLGQLIVDHDFSAGVRDVYDPPNLVPWYWTKSEASTAFFDVQPGSLDWTSPAANTWNPNGIFVPFAEVGGVTIQPGEQLVVRWAISQSSIAENTPGNQRGMRWGIFTYEGADVERPASDFPDEEDPARFPGQGTTGYHVGMSLHANAENEGIRLAKRTTLENTSVIGSFGAWSIWDPLTEETDFTVPFVPGTQVFFPDVLYRVEWVFDRVGEAELHITFTITDEDGNIAVSASVVDDRHAGVDPYFTFDSFVVRAQVSGGTATGSVFADPRAGVDEVEGTMSFKEFSVEIVSSPDAELWNDMRVIRDEDDRAWVDSPLLGFMMVEYAPWVWVDSLQSWFFLPEHDAEGSWVFSPNVQ